MQMSVEHSVKVLAQQIKVFTWVELLEMHVSSQRGQRLGVGVGKASLIGRKRVVHGVNAER